MAEKPSTPSDALKKLEEQLTCSICLGHYNNPKTIPCLHSFCHQCLQGIPLDPQGDKLILMCPLCRTLTELPEAGVAGFPTAFLVNNLIEVHSHFEKVSGDQTDQHVSCGNCKKGNATRYCKQCAKLLCAGCLDFHSKWENFCDHTVISLDEFVRTAASQPPQPSNTSAKCSSHNKPLEIYCETCHILICQHCTVKKHKEHEYDLVSDTYDKHRQTIKSSLVPVKQQIVAVKEAVAILTEREKEITHQRETVKETICVAIKEVTDLFLQLEQKLTKDVDLAASHKLSILSQQKTEAEMTLRQLTDCFDFVEQGLEVGTPEQVLSEKSQMIDRANRIIMNIKLETFLPLEQADIKLVESKKIEDVHKNIGEVTYTLSCKVRNVSSHLALMGKESTSTIRLECPDGCPIPVLLRPPLITCSLISPDNDQPTECKVEESLQSGQYKVVFTPITRGIHQLHVRVHDIDIPGSPLSIPVSLSPEMRSNPVKTIDGLDRPWGIDVTDDGLLTVSEYHGNCITLLDTEGKVVNSFGSEGNGKSQFKSPTGVAFTPNGTILVADSGNHRIQELTKEGECKACVGERGSGQIQFLYPRGIAINKSTKQIFIADEYNHRIQVLNPDLSFSHMFGGNGSGQGQFNRPWGVALDSKGFVYVADTDNHRVQRFTPGGRLVLMFGTEGSKPGQLVHPSGIAVDDNNLLYVAEGTNQRVTIFTASGKFIHCFGEKGNNGQPVEIAFDKNGYLYVCDLKNSNIVVY